ncbi:MAG: hypothetical protein DI585_04305 [Pseudomonas fluorescens]|uniref:Uncharacterized protein n=1 Tax=Blastochloris viridis TaxID=1079 RepID=A0A6N4RDD0_BLAVI|nr:MAG: hypothetical protein DI585_04305 [Pseudomonas fluorescens]TKW61074.1 MAG: hypothetical protein DI628_00130 [Blastochloris viridis]
MSPLEFYEKYSSIIPMREMRPGELEVYAPHVSKYVAISKDYQFTRFGKLALKDISRQCMARAHEVVKQSYLLHSSYLEDVDFLVSQPPLGEEWWNSDELLVIHPPLVDNFPV